MRFYIFVWFLLNPTMNNIKKYSKQLDFSILLQKSFELIEQSLFGKLRVSTMCLSWVDLIGQNIQFKSPLTRLCKLSIIMTCGI